MRLDASGLVFRVICATHRFKGTSPNHWRSGLPLTALVFASLSRLRFLVWRRPRDPEEGRDDRRTGKETSEEDRTKL